MELVECWLGMARPAPFLIYYFFNELPQEMSLALAFCMGFCASLS